MRTTLRSISAAAVALCAASPAFGQFFFDDFNRANSPDLGPNWTHVQGTSATRVINNQAGNTAGSNNLSLVNASNFTAPYTTSIVQADIFHSGVVGTGFVALAMGHNGAAAAGNGLYIKVQSQGGVAAFTNVGFYTGNGSSSTTPWTDPPVFFTLTSNFTQARMTIWASDATTINLGLDTDFNGVDDQLYTRHLNLGAMTFGTQVGLGVFGTNVTADDYRATVVPEPASMVALGLGLAGLVARRRRTSR